jgi:MFS family permease
MDASNFNDINWLAVFVAALAYFMLGAIWYSKALFANRWIRHTKIDMSNPDVKKGMAAIMITSFVLMFITCVGLAILRSRLDLSGWMSGLKLGLLTGICFGMTAISISYVYEKRSTELHLINGAYTVVGNVIAAIIICCWL